MPSSTCHASPSHEPAIHAEERPEVPRSSPRLPVAVYVLAAGTFLMGTTEFIVAGLLPEVASDFAITQAQAGHAITVFAIGMIIGAPIVPLLTLRLARRTTLLVALVLFAAAHVVLAVTDSFVLLLVGRFVAALATGTFWAVAAVVAASMVGPQRSSGALGIVLGGGMLATVVGVPAGSFAGQLIGWRGPFWVLAALALAAVFAVGRAVPGATPGAPTPRLRRELTSLRSGRLWLTLATCAAVSAGVLSVYSFVAPLTDRAGLSDGYVPLALLLFGIGALLGSLVGGRLGDTHPLRTPLATASVSLAAIAVMCLVSTNAVVIIAAFAVLGAVGLSSNAVLVSLATRYGGTGATLPSAMATSMFNLGTAVGTTLTGAALGTSLGALAIPLVGLTFAVVVFVPLTALVISYRRTQLSMGSCPLRRTTA